jgi:DNA-binding PadR family transcriptional regulator
MAGRDLTDAELLVLGLVAEMPRHGYELAQVIEDRSMREWTQIGFSSIYFVLGKLETMSLVSAATTAGRSRNPKARRVYAVTRAGRRALIAQTRNALTTLRRSYSSALLGMINWPVLARDDGLDALATRRQAIEAEVERLVAIQLDQQPLPDFVEALFDHSIGQLKAEGEWVTRTYEYMATKPWLD